MMYEDRSKSAGYLLLAISAISSLILVVGYTIGIQSALQGIYLPASFLLAGLALVLNGSVTNRYFQFMQLLSPKMVTTLGLAGIYLLMIFKFNFFITLVYISTMSVFLVANLNNKNSAIILICFITFSACVRKFSSNYFYHGPGDILVHLDIIGEFMSKSVISVDYIYQDFPAYHLVISTLSTISGIRPYVGFLIVSITLSVSLVLFSFRVSRWLTGSTTISLVATSLFCMSWVYLLFNTYFIPQSMAVYLLMTLLLCLLLKEKSKVHKNHTYSILCILIVSSLSVTHHLTFIILLPPSIIYVITNVKFGDNHVISNIHNTWPIYLLLILIPVSHWIYNGTFIYELSISSISLLYTVIDSLLVVGGGGGGVGGTIYLGDHQAIGIIFSVLSFQKIHYVFLLSLIFIGSVASSLNVHLRGIIFTALIGIPIVFPTPVGLSPRFGYPWIYLLAIVASWSLTVDKPSLTEHKQFTNRSVVISAILCLTLVSGAAAAADDVNELNPGPQEKVSISEKEFQELRQTSQYLKRFNNDPVLTPRITGKLFRSYFSTDDIYYNLTATESGFVNNDKRVVYRESWANHRISPIVGQGPRDPSYVMTLNWLEKEIYYNNKIHSTGSVGVGY